MTGPGSRMRPAPSACVPAVHWFPRFHGPPTLLPWPRLRCAGCVPQGAYGGKQRQHPRHERQPEGKGHRWVCHGRPPGERMAGPAHEQGLLRSSVSTRLCVCPASFALCATAPPHLSDAPHPVQCRRSSRATRRCWRRCTTTWRVRQGEGALAGRGAACTTVGTRWASTSAVEISTGAAHEPPLHPLLRGLPVPGPAEKFVQHGLNLPAVEAMRQYFSNLEGPGVCRGGLSCLRLPPSAQRARERRSPCQCARLGGEASSRPPFALALDPSPAALPLFLPSTAAGDPEPLEYDAFPVPLPPGAVRLGVIFFQVGCVGGCVAWCITQPLLCFLRVCVASSVAVRHTVRPNKQACMLASLGAAPADPACKTWRGHAGHSGTGAPARPLSCTHVSACQRVVRPLLTLAGVQRRAR